MKKHILFLATMFCLTTTFAQEKQVIKETFETNKYQWDEFYENSCTASIQDGYLLLENGNKTMLRSVVELPINIDRNFKISFNINVKKVSDDDWFGIVYNYEDENNFCYFLIQEKKFTIINKVNSVSSVSRKGNIILKSEKEKDVNIDMEKKGNKIIFSVDNMEVISITKNFVNNTIGCCVLGENTIKVNELVIEQTLN